MQCKKDLKKYSLIKLIKVQWQYGTISKWTDLNNILYINHYFQLKVTDIFL